MINIVQARRHDPQHNDIRPNDTQHDNIQHTNK
jgi:hypothetical protein